MYGTRGIPAAGNVPGVRYGATGWMDSAGNFWLFGGIGQDSGIGVGPLNDLWEFNPSTNEWAWMAGSSNRPCEDADCGQYGVYGVLGTPSAANTPGGRGDAVGWTDSNGNFWLFGGNGFASAGIASLLNDLWVFNPSTNTWTWMGGNSTVEFCR